MQITHNQLSSLIISGYKAKVPLDIKGPVGIGKSEVIYNVARTIANKENKEFVVWNEISETEKIKYIDKNLLAKSFIYADLRLSQFDQTDLKGYPINADEYAVWKPTLLFKVLSDPIASGILFFDEMNLANHSVMASAYQIINDNQIGETPISKNVYMVSAGNRSEDTNNSWDDPPPLNNRRMNVELLIPTMDEWINWAGKEEIDSRIIAYLQWKQTNLFKYEPSSKDPSFPSPRMWYKASKMIKGVNRYEDIRTFVGACVGEGVAIEFVAFIKLSSTVDIREILKNPKLMEKYKGQDFLDIKYSVVSGITEIFRRDNNILNDALLVCQYMEPEFGIFMLRMFKNMTNKFGNLLIKCKNWSKCSKEYAEFLL